MKLEFLRFFFNTQMEKFKMVEGIFQTSWKKKIHIEIIYLKIVLYKK